MAFTVVYDACVLYPAPLRDLLIGIAGTGIVRARWSDQILDECFRNVALNRPDIPAERRDRTRALMNTAVPDCLVSDYHALVGALSLPDEDDRHVLAAAIRCGAQAIITFNLKDFPLEVLASFDNEAKHPDDFVHDTLGLAEGAVLEVLTKQVERLKNPPQSLADVLDTLRNAGLGQSVAHISQLFGPRLD